MKTKNLILKVLFVFSPLALGNNLQPSVMLTEKVEDFFTTGVNRSSKHISLQRTYQSRSLHRGVMGYGWCLQFEKVLIKQTSGRVDYYNCLSDRPIRFTFHSQKNESYIFRPLNAPGLSLKYKDKQWILTDAKKSQWYFETSGRLRKWTLRHHQKFHLVWNRDGTMRQLHTPGGVLRMKQDPLTRLLEKITFKNKTIHYVYKNHLLSSAKSPQTTWTYDYDISRNLSKISKNSKIIKSISYNIAKDQVERLIASSYVIQINSAGQIQSIQHPIKGTVIFHYSKQGEIVFLLLNQERIEFQKLNAPTRTIKTRTVLKYLNVASTVIKSLKTL